MKTFVDRFAIKKIGSFGKSHLYTERLPQTFITPPSNYTNKITLNQPPEIVIYDWHGTLIRLDADRFLNSLNAALIAFSQTPLNSLKESKSVRHTLSTRCKGNEKEALEIFRREFFSTPILKKDLLSGVEELIKHTSQLGIPQAIVSNQDQFLLNKELELLKLRHYFKAIVGSNSDHELKPKPDLILQAIKDLKSISNKRIWYVGDTESDVIASKAAGCTSILISDPKITSEADILIPSITSLNSMLTAKEKCI